ncbi:MAG: nucleotide exchange factor GrpE [Chloroflexota bacterium]
MDSKKLKALAEQLKATAAERDAARTERDEIAGQAEELVAKVDEYVLALQRERAEFVNFKRRTADERQRDMGLAGVDLIGKVLNLADDFDRAIETRPADMEGNAWIEGIAAIDRKLRLLLESEGVHQVDANPGMAFDPREHEAVTTVPGTGRPENEIVGEIRRGYRLRDRLIRPALVAVAAAPDPEPDAGAEPVN